MISALSPTDTVSTPLVLIMMAGCLALILFLIGLVGLQRLCWHLASDYARRREERFSDAVLGVLLEPQQLLALRATTLWRRGRLGPRLFDTSILEHMLLQQAVELRGADRQVMTSAFEDGGLVERAIRQMRSLRWWRRLAAAYKLGVMRSPRGVAALLRGARDRRPQVRLAALRSLAEINDTSTYPLLLRALEEGATSVQMIDIVLSLGPGVCPALIERFGSLRDRHLQAIYARLLGLLQEPAALDLLLPLLQSDDPHLRREAIGAVGAIGDASAITALNAALGEPDAQLRAEAARALGRLGAPASVSELQPLLDDAARAVRYAAARALIRLGNGGCSALEQAARGSNPDSRGIAEQVLAERALGLV